MSRQAPPRSASGAPPQGGAASGPAEPDPRRPLGGAAVRGATTPSASASAPHSPLRILGIDPGLQRTGFGVVEADGPRLRYVASGTISTLEAPRGDLPGRLALIFGGVQEVMREYAPHCASVEIVFVNVNPQSTLLLGQARGAALAALVSGGLPVSEYTALQMKKAVVGQGLAAKAQVQAMVQRLLALPGAPGADAADALGLAITHAHAGATLGALGAATTLQRRSHAQYRKGRAY